ncbi:hypothetical protein ACIQAA_08440 [Neobacillus sp. NPDC093182]|uniref:hypothetical protein n=1 Tax=Neobacillus sp. NPDC093182 TaxID=3364297 RepID=UPI0038020CA6
MRSVIVAEKGESPKKAEAVWMPVPFGQSKLWKSRICQNRGHIRTEQALEKQNLSEWRSHSDRASSGKAESVRMEVTFGQTAARKSRRCQKAGSIRTEQALEKQNLSE